MTFSQTSLCVFLRNRKKSACNQTHLPHQPKVLVHFRFQFVNLCHKRVFEAPQDLVDGAGHENINAKAFQVHWDHASKEEGVGIQLIHHSLTENKTNKINKKLPSHGTASENVTMKKTRDNDPRRVGGKTVFEEIINKACQFYRQCSADTSVSPQEECWWFWQCRPRDRRRTSRAQRQTFWGSGRKVLSHSPGRLCFLVACTPWCGQNVAQLFL